MPGQLVVDDEGMELPGLDAAKKEAAESAREVIAEALKEGGDVAGYAYNVTDDHGEQVMIYEFKPLLDGGGG